MTSATWPVMNATTTDQLVEPMEPSETELDQSYAYYCNNYTEYFVCLPKPVSEKIWILIVELILHTAVAVFGVIANCLTIVILSKDKTSSSTKIILRSLAVCDITSLMLSVLYNFSKNYVFYYTESDHYRSDTAVTLAHMLVRFTVPMSSAAVYGSHVITVMVTIDRYIAVCRPMVIRKERQVNVTLLVIVVCVIAYNIPLCFEYIVLTYAGIYRENFHQNVSIVVAGIQKRTEWNDNIGFQAGYNVVMSIVLRDIGPIVLLVIFNIKLYIALVRMKKRYLNMKKGHQGKESRRHITTSETMTRTVVMVVVVYTTLTLPASVLKLITTTRQLALLVGNNKVVRVLGPVVYNVQYKSVCNLLISTASSANFIIYIIFARKFRKIFVKTFCTCAMMRNRFEDMLMSTTSEAATKTPNNMAATGSKVQPVDNSMNTINSAANGTREQKETSQ